MNGLMECGVGKEKVEQYVRARLSLSKSVTSEKAVTEPKKCLNVCPEAKLNTQFQGILIFCIRIQHEESWTLRPRGISEP